MSEIELPEINISPEHKKEIAKKKGVTTQAVRNALKYHSNSLAAQEIRTEAIAVLQNEAKKARIIVKSKK